MVILVVGPQEDNRLVNGTRLLLRTLKLSRRSPLLRANHAAIAKRNGFLNLSWCTPKMKSIGRSTMSIRLLKPTQIVTVPSLTVWFHSLPSMSGYILRNGKGLNQWGMKYSLPSTHTRLSNSWHWIRVMLKTVLTVRYRGHCNVITRAKMEKLPAR